LHYVGGYQSGHVSADYFAIFADRMQQLIKADRTTPPFVAMMSNGTSGDINNIDFRKPRERRAAWTRMREVAHDLAEVAFRIYRQIDYRDRAPLSVTTTNLQLGVRRPDAQRLEWAEGVTQQDTDPARLTRREIYAHEALELAAWLSKLKVR
jgi:hypothetical protein